MSLMRDGAPLLHAASPDWSAQMIASNYRKHPDAMALQRPLPFDTRLVWHTARPGSRILRAIRAARSHAFKAAGRIRYVAAATVPAWWKERKLAARQLADTIKAACMPLIAAQ